MKNWKELFWKQIFQSNDFKKFSANFEIFSRFSKRYITLTITLPNFLSFHSNFLLFFIWKSASVRLGLCLLQLWLISWC